MQEFDPSDEVLAQWAHRDVTDRVQVAGVVWRRYAEPVFWRLYGKFKETLSFHDCRDVTDDAFSVLSQGLTGGTFEWQGSLQLQSYLHTVAGNLARDLVRKRARRATYCTDFEDIDEAFLRVGFDYQRIFSLEETVLRETRFDTLFEELIDCVRKMKPKQRAVGALIVNCIQNTSRRPSNERLLEQLLELEPNLKLSTVIDRRKEVLAKFEPIIEKFRGDLWKDM